MHSLQTADSLDCMARDGERGERCIAEKEGQGGNFCAAMTCGENGEVLVEGSPCNPGATPSQMHSTSSM